MTHFRNGILHVLLTAALVFVGTMASSAQGTLTVAISSNLNTLDPNIIRFGEEYVYAGLVFNGLVRLDRQGRLQPDLATSWTSSDDLKTWTFELRPGVKFHDGKDFDAADVVATMKRIMDKSVGSVARTNLTMVSSVKAIGKLKVQFTLSQPYAGFAELFAEHQMRIVPSDKIGTMAQHPDGTGPFKFVSYSPGDRLVLEKNPNYFRKGKPHIDKVVLRIMPEIAAQIAALRTGDIDLIWNIPPEAVRLLKSDSSVFIDSIATGAWDGLIMNNSVKPFDDPRVRKAVSMALDKQALVDGVLFGQGTVTVTPIPASSPYFYKGIKAVAANPAAAKKLLAEAGFPNGFDATLYLPIGRPTRERLGVMASQMLKAAGIRVKLQRVPWDQFNKEIEGKAPLYADGFFSRATIDTSVYPFYHSAGSWNAGLWHYKNKNVDKLLDQARATKDEAERQKLYQQFQMAVEQDPPSVIAYNLNHTNALSKRVTGFHSSPLMLLNLEDVRVSK